MERPLLISEMRPEDISDCVQVLLDNPLWERYGVSASKASEMFKAALVDGARILVAHIGEKAVGFVWYVPRGAWDRSGYIRLIGVSPEYQGHRVGERLMEAAEARMKSTAGEVFLLVTDFNVGAQRFYRRLGYTQIGAIPDYVVPGINELIFYKKLLGK